MRFIAKVILITFFVSLVPLKQWLVFAQDDDRFHNFPHTNEIIVQYFHEDKPRLVSVGQDENFDKILKSYRKNRRVRYAEPNYKLFASEISAPATSKDESKSSKAKKEKHPNDPLENMQVYLNQVHVPQAWRLTTGKRNVIVAVLDAGVDIKHPDLSRNIWVNVDEIGKNDKDDDKNRYVDDVNGYDFISDTPNPGPKASNMSQENLAGLTHGTVIAGLIGAVGNNAKGVAGVNWKVRIMPLRVLNERGEGGVETVARGIDYAVDNGADIINMSFVGYITMERLNESLERAYKKGVLIVAASGNALRETNGVPFDLDLRPAYPACFRGDNDEKYVIGVSALDSNDRLAPFSNYGNRCVEVSAPGVAMFSTQTIHEPFGLSEPYGNNFLGQTWSGTSFAAPLVSGVAALMLAANPKLKPSDIMRILSETGDPIDELNMGFEGKIGKKLNAAFAVKEAKAEKKKKKTRRTKKEIKENEDKVVNPLFERLTTPRISVLSRTNEVIDLRLYNQDLLMLKVISGDISSLPLNSRLLVTDLFFDGQEEMIVYGGDNNRAVSLLNNRGILQNSFDVFENTSLEEVDIAVGDVDGNGSREIIATQANSENGVVRIFTSQGEFVREIFVYPGVQVSLDVASSDMNGDGKDEIIVGVREGTLPEVVILSGNGEVMRRFFTQQQMASMYVSAGDITGDGVSEIVTLHPALGNLVSVFDKNGRRKKMFGITLDDSEIIGFDVGTFDENSGKELMVNWRTTTQFGALVVSQVGEVIARLDNSELGAIGIGPFFYYER